MNVLKSATKLIMSLKNLKNVSLLKNEEEKLRRKNKLEEKLKLGKRRKMKHSKHVRLNNRLKQKLKRQNKRQKYKDQNRVIFSTVSEDQESFAAKCHLVKTNAVTIRNSVKTLSKKLDINQYRELGAIAMASERILGSLKYSALANFNLRDEFIQEDLFLFCSQFINNILAKQYHEIEFDLEQEGK